MIILIIWILGSIAAYFPTKYVYNKTGGDTLTYTNKDKIAVIAMCIAITWAAFIVSGLYWLFTNDRYWFNKQAKW